MTYFKAKAASKNARMRPWCVSVIVLQPTFSRAQQSKAAEKIKEEVKEIVARNEVTLSWMDCILLINGTTLAHWTQNLTV